MDSIKLKVTTKSPFSLPKYEYPGSAGMDLRANIGDSVVLSPLQRVLIPTGLFIELPKGVEAQVRSRSGLALKKGLIVLNSPGTIDAGYLGEIGVILINLSATNQTINPGDRIAQLVFASVIEAELEQITMEEFDKIETERSKNGFGSSGVI